MVVADLTAAHEHAIVAVGAGKARGENVVLATEGAADVTTDIEAGPVVDRGGANIGP